VLNGEKAILCADERELINFAYPCAQASRAGTRACFGAVLEVTKMIFRSKNLFQPLLFKAFDK
jgi:hypothetical protein